MNIFKQIYNKLNNPPIYGNEIGICRVTGEKSKGVLFDKWVKKTFNEYDSLFDGDIISNEAYFTFEEKSKYLAEHLNKEKGQSFRNYSHIILKNEWYPLTKANKKEMYELIIQNPEIVCLAESGQKHIFFKHKAGFWQLENNFVEKDIDLLKDLHTTMMQLIELKFTQTQVITGNYFRKTIQNAGIKKWNELENKLKKYRGSKIFDFAAFMIYNIK